MMNESKRNDNNLSFVAKQQSLIEINFFFISGKGNFKEEKIILEQKISQLIEQNKELEKIIESLKDEVEKQKNSITNNIIINNNLNINDSENDNDKKEREKIIHDLKINNKELLFKIEDLKNKLEEINTNYELLKKQKSVLTRCIQEKEGFCFLI
jgi:hypothetical protein